MPLPALLLGLAALGSTAGAGAAGAAGAGGLAAAGGAAAGAAGAGAGLAAGALPAAGAAGAGGLALSAPASMAPSMAPMANLTQPFASTAQAAGAPAGGGMNFGGIASKFAAPGTPGSVGGTPMPMPSGATPSGPGFMDKLSGMMNSDEAGVAKKMAGLMGNAAQSGTQGPPVPQLQGGGLMPFTPFQFSRNNYQFRRPLGF